MKILIAALSMCLATGITTGQDRGWRELVPLHSTRSAVERLLGKPTQVLNENEVFYRTEIETIIISYTNGRPCGIGEKYSQWRVPRDTVQKMLVTPTKEFPFSDLRIDANKYQRRSGGHRSEDVNYINDQDGMSLRVFKGNVMSISVYPSQVDSDKKCSPSTVVNCQNPSPPMFDSYTKVSLRQERLHLENFGVALFGSPETNGYIIAYGGTTGRPREAQTLAKRAKDYLVRTRHLPSSRIIMIDGGFQEKRKVELYVVKANECPPVRSPTIDPRDVRVFY